MKKYTLIIFLLLLPFTAMAEKNILNLYTWGGEIPTPVLRQFEKETGIEVNLSTYENNEIMYAKLRTTRNAGYDIIMPSGYFVDKLRKQDLLLPIDKTKVPNWKNIDSTFLNTAYDPTSSYSAPFLWGITGIFVNHNYHSPKKIQKWTDLWDSSLQNQIMLLDDMREVFGMALLSLGYSVNDKDPEHIKAAFLKLKALMPNVKVFASDTLVSIMIDEDATIGMAWNGDAFKSSIENKAIKFVVPKDGFVMWVDTFAIPKSAPHVEAAHKFIDFMLRPDIAAAVTLYSHYPTAILAAQKILPADIRNNTIAYPPKDVLKHGQFQTDLDADTIALYEKYWNELKMGG